MEIRVTKAFKDFYTGRMHEVGEVMIVNDAARADNIVKQGFGKPATEEVKAPEKPSK